MSQFPHTDIDAIKANKQRQSVTVNLNELYKETHSELSLQQTKRDQTISIYLSLCTVVAPIILSIEYFNSLYKGVIFLVLGIIGVLLSTIIIRYKVYKDIYWMSCQTISQLFNYTAEDIDKELVQGLFYQVLYKKGKKYVKIGEQRNRFRNAYFFKSNLFSAETLLFVTMIFIVAIVSGMGLALTCAQPLLISIIIGLSLGLLVFCLLLWEFFRKCKKIYKVLVDGEDSSFNAVFSKAWFLHFYE